MINKYFLSFDSFFDLKNGSTIFIFPGFFYHILTVLMKFECRSNWFVCSTFQYMFFHSLFGSKDSFTVWVKKCLNPSCTMFFMIILINLRYLIIQVQNGNGVLNRLVTCLKCMELACWLLQVIFGSVLLPYVSKNDDEERCFLK